MNWETRYRIECGMTFKTKVKGLHHFFDTVPFL